MKWWKNYSKIVNQIFDILPPWLQYVPLMGSFEGRDLMSSFNWGSFLWSTCFETSVNNSVFICINWEKYYACFLQLAKDFCGHLNMKWLVVLFCLSKNRVYNKNKGLRQVCNIRNINVSKIPTSSIKDFLSILKMKCL